MSDRNLKRTIRGLLLRLAVIPFSILSRRGFLHDMGWFRSLARGSYDLHGEPIPWWSYTFILFLKDRLSPDLAVFEYGSGNSTLWLSARVHRVYSVETDRGWYEHVRRKLPANVDLRFQIYEKGGDYCRLIRQHVGQFDVIVIDGFDRVRCAKHCVSALTPRGVIIFDDAHQDHLVEGPAFLIEQGFKRIDFFGMGPQQDSTHCTSLFYRDGNCIGV